jgi:O-antigen/teichoic acid export membrane protein
VSWAFGLAVLPLLSRLERQTRSLGRVFAISCMAIAAITVPVGAAMALFGPTIVESVFGADFEGGGTATRILGGGAALYGIFTVAALTIAGQDRQAALPWIGGGGLLVNVGLNFALIPPLGLDGAAIAMTATQALITIATMWIAIRETGAVSPVRMFGAAAAGLAAMCAVGLALGQGGLSMLASLVVYAVVFLAVEWLLHRDDLELFARALRQRGGAAGVEPQIESAP